MERAVMMRSWLLLVGLLGLACSEGGGRARDEEMGTGMVLAAAGSGGAPGSAAPGAMTPGGMTPGVAAPGSDGAAAGAPSLVVGNISGLLLGDPLELVA